MIRKNSYEYVYTDIHIHTSENPDIIKEGVKYDYKELIKRIDSISKDNKKLISFTDHNTINKAVYLYNFPDLYYLLLGVELHISYDKEKKPYHCHILFNCEINDYFIDDINKKLDELYPKKQIDKDDYGLVPRLEEIINKFSNYEFILLPHGGQSHCTFDKAIPKGPVFDDVIEKTLYYNQFDGFTSRSTNGKDKTISYFKKLGIDDFTNLITCSDNYNPNKYPEPKADIKEKFIPTWILSEPNYDGLRLALSEIGRLSYSETPPTLYEEYIENYFINNSLLDIDVNFQPGLNVIIGESSSGKSLLVDSLVKYLNPKLGKTDYSDKYDFSELKITNNAGFLPYYINQNYIMEVSNKNRIEDISIVKNMFGPTEKTERNTKKKLNDLDIILTNLINSVDKIEQYQEKLNALTNIERLILFKNNNINPLENLFPMESIIEKLDYSKDDYDMHLKYLEDILKISHNNINIPNIDNEIKIIKNSLKIGYKKSEFENCIRKILKKKKEDFEKNYKYKDAELKIKNDNYEKAKYYICKYIEELDAFKKTLHKLSKFSYKNNSKPIKVANHQLFVENKLEITEKVVIDIINDFLRTDNKITNFDDIGPSNLFLNKFSGSFRINNYNTLKRKIYSKFEENNKYTYKIITSDRRKWEELSPGWKTAILTELILQYDNDQAPLIIDQPEDNLANKYINIKLIEDIKKAKKKKQIIIVSHNATIPILADAENLIYCKSNGEKIYIRSNCMENKIDDKSCLDIIAEITDGGKKSIKKRFKKYNIKTYKEDKNEF